MDDAGKIMRVLPMRELDVYRVEYYIHQAIMINIRKGEVKTSLPN